MAICPDNTIDSNVTGLAIAEEVCPGVLPTQAVDGHDPVWYEAEPNTYPDSFGATLKTKARSPIKQNRQRSKGTTVDLDAASGWNSDYTQSNMTRLMQGFFFADAREKATTAPMNGVDGVLVNAMNTDNSLNGTGLARFRVGSLIYIKGSLLNSTGIRTVATSTVSEITTVEDTADETFPDNVSVIEVGRAFASGALAVAASGNIGTLHLATAPAAGTSALTVAVGNAAAADTVTIGDVVYTFVTGAPVNPYDVTIGADVTTTATNLKTTINGGSTLTPAHPLVTATNTLGVLTATAKIKGTTENDIATLASGTNLSWNHAVLTGGTGISLLSLGMTPGEWGFLGGDATGTHFVNNVGYFRVGSVTDTDLVMDRTTWDVQVEAATGLTIQVFTGTLIQNENDPDLIKRRTYQMQRKLGKDAGGTQSQYVKGNVANTLSFNMQLSADLTVDLAYLAMGNEYRTGAQGLKAGTLVPALNEDAINTTNDLYEAAMYVIDSTNSNSARLFGYLSEAKLTINNNASIVKGLGVLGGIGVNTGIFEVSGTAMAYFTSVEANIAVDNNADVGEYFILAKHNAGSVWDIGLTSLGGGSMKIESNKPITVALTTDAAQNVNGSTLTNTIFGYLPTLAMPATA